MVVPWPQGQFVASGSGGAGSTRQHHRPHGAHPFPYCLKEHRGLKGKWRGSGGKKRKKRRPGTGGGKMEGSGGKMEGETGGRGENGGKIGKWRKVETVEGKWRKKTGGTGMWLAVCRRGRQRPVSAKNEHHQVEGKWRKKAGENAMERRRGQWREMEGKWRKSCRPRRRKRMCTMGAVMLAGAASTTAARCNELALGPWNDHLAKVTPAYSN
eukprot:gene18039-biopygen6879